MAKRTFVVLLSAVSVYVMIVNALYLEAFIAARKCADVGTLVAMNITLVEREAVSDSKLLPTDL